MAPTATVTPAPAPGQPNVDLVYGAYQRGQYKTAFDLATKRAQENGDPKAMTMLGELYANAMGVKRDYAKAAEWYKRAADGGDREGMFALAMLRLAGRGGPVDREEGGEAAGVLGEARRTEGGVQSGAALSRRTDAAAGPHARRAIAAHGRRRRQSGGAIRARDLLQGGHRRRRRTSRSRSGCCRRLRWPTISTPRSNMRSRFTTAPARRRTKPPRWRCCARPPGKTARSPKTASRGCW